MGGGTKSRDEMVVLPYVRAPDGGANVFLPGGQVVHLTADRIATGRTCVATEVGEHGVPHNLFAVLAAKP